MATKWKKGWKVIRKDTRQSCTAINRMHPVKYIKNKCVHRPAKSGPLAVFETRRAAREFINSGSVNSYPIKEFCKVVKCLYTEASETFLWEFYTYTHGITIKNENSILPPRTALADAVKCLE